ncbi:MAG TPA: ATP-binding protein, partial [Azospirillaceae bacterium]|nr:ATP-binding protein [Azospirillaceae bacterium]
AEVAARVARARLIQAERFAELGQKVAGGRALRCNADADGELLERIAAPDQDGRNLLTQAAERLKLSARGYHRMMRVARTLADLEGAEGVRRIHVAEALSYRRMAPGR